MDLTMMRIHTFIVGIAIERVVGDQAFLQTWRKWLARRIALLFRGGQVPEPDCLVATAAHQPLTVRAEINIDYNTFMAFQRQDLSSALYIPDLHRLIVTTTRQQTIAGTKCDAIYNRGVALEGPDYLA